MFKKYNLFFYYFLKKKAEKERDVAKMIEMNPSLIHVMGGPLNGWSGFRGRKQGSRGHSSPSASKVRG